MPTEDAIELEQPASPASPGRLLAQAREKAGLSQKEVADKLHITAHYVRSIEQDAYEKLPGTIFAKGYIKRYAEILDINVAAILQEFEEYQQDQQDQRNEVTRIHARKNRARNRNFAIVSVLAFIAVFVGLWAWNVMSVEQDNAVDNAARNNVIGDRIASAMELEPEQADDSTLQPSTTSQGPADPTPQTVGEVEPDDPPIFDSAANSVEGMTEESDLTVIAISNEGSDVLRVSFDDDSFIQVSDENANRIYRGTLGRGEVLEITDDAPFDVLVSDAPLAHMTLNGTEVDVMDSVRIDNSARLTVGL